MAAGDSNRILTTHVGSLVRPAELVAFFQKKQDGVAYEENAYQDCLRKSVTEVVRQQAETGIDIVSDGEFGKSISWSRYIHERLTGFEERPAAEIGLKEGEVILPGNDRRRFKEFYDEYDKTQGYAGSSISRVCNGKIEYVGQALLQRDIDNLTSAMKVSGVTRGFLPVVAPASVTAARTDDFYKTEEDYVFAIAEAMREEYRTIVEAGLYVQVDDAHLPYMYDRMVPPGTVQDYRKWCELRIAALNHALQGIPEDRVRYHVCWGSWNGPHTGDVPLKDIVDMILRVKAGGYAIEAANPRHEHEWQVWETVRMPAGRKLIPGVISHSTNVVEHPELVAQRLVRFVKVLGEGNVIAGTDCGFAQGPFTRRVHPSIMWAKLQSLVEGARLASEKLRGQKAS